MTGQSPAAGALFVFKPGGQNKKSSKRELNCQIDVYYSEADHCAFRIWLKRKYGTLDKLNHPCGTVFWSQTYTDWQQVHLTRVVVSNSPNPHQVLDEKRFISDNTIDFAKVQTDILRDIVPHH